MKQEIWEVYDTFKTNMHIIFKCAIHIIYPKIRRNNFVYGSIVFCLFCSTQAT